MAFISKEAEATTTMSESRGRAKAAIARCAATLLISAGAIAASPAGSEPGALKVDMGSAEGFAASLEAIEEQKGADVAERAEVAAQLMMGQVSDVEAIRSAMLEGRRQDAEALLQDEVVRSQAHITEMPLDELIERGESALEGFLERRQERADSVVTRLSSQKDDIALRQAIVNDTRIGVEAIRFNEDGFGYPVPELRLQLETEADATITGGIARFYAGDDERPDRFSSGRVHFYLETPAQPGQRGQGTVTLPPDASIAQLDDNPDLDGIRFFVAKERFFTEEWGAVTEPTGWSEQDQAQLEEAREIADTSSHGLDLPASVIRRIETP